MAKGRSAKKTFKVETSYRSKKTGRMVSKAYAQAHPRAVSKTKAYRSLLTGWKIKKEKIRKAPSRQIIGEISRSKKKMSVARKQILGDVAEFRLMSQDDLFTLMELSPRYVGKVQWGLSARGRKVMDKRTYKKLQEAFDDWLEEHEFFEDEEDDE